MIYGVVTVGRLMELNLEHYTSSWPDDDPDANFKREVAEYTRADPMPALCQLAENTHIPIGALVRYVLVKWTAEGSEALMALGPRMVQRLWAVCECAESRGTDAARLDAYAQLRDMLSWLRLPLVSGGPPPNPLVSGGPPPNPLE